MQDSKSFMGYKKDQRRTLEVSPMNNEKYVQKQQEKSYELKTKLKYRIYGPKGVNPYEIRKLVNIGEIEKKEPHYPLPKDDHEL